MKSKLIKKKNSDIYLFSTSVENLFINELLPIAPGDYVKIYLFSLMYAEQEQTISNEKAAQVLGVTPDKMEKAWNFWEEKGAIKRVYGDPEEGEDDKIVFVSQIEELYGAKNNGDEPVEGGNDAEAKLIDMELRALFTEYEDAKGNAISQREMERIDEAVNELKVAPDVFSYAIRYCVELNKTNIDYISKVATKWKEEGCEDIAQVKALLDKYSKRNSFYKRVFGEMGFNRMPNPADKDMMARWFDEWGFSLDEVLNACRLTGGMREPSLKYVNKVLENKRLEAGGIKPGTMSAKPTDESGKARVSKRVLDEYLKALRDEDERKHKAKVDEVCAKDPRIEKAMLYLSDLNRNILSFDFSPEAKGKRNEQKERKRGLEGALKQLLEEDGYPPDYLDMKYKCEICRDTGITDDGRNCACLKLRANEAYKWNTERNR